MEMTLQQLTFAYEAEQSVLRGVSARLGPGLVHGVIGPNGSGKTTLIKLMSGALTPRSGSVALDGAEIGRLSARQLARAVAVVPQKSDLAFDFTVLDVVLMGRQPYIGRFAREGEADLRRAEEAMRQTGVYELRGRAATSLSGGEWQRVLIARALCQDTPVLLLDEPVSNLDVRHQIDILLLARQRARRAGALVAVVLHDLNLAAHFCDDLLLLAGGELIAQGRPAEVLRPERLKAVYGIDARVLVGPDGALDVLPEFPILAS